MCSIAWFSIVCALVCLQLQRHSFPLSLSCGFSGSIGCVWMRDALSAPVLPSVLSGGSSPFVAFSPVLDPMVRFCVPEGYLGSYCGVLFALFGCFVGLVSTYSYEKDVNRHAQQVRTRISWQIGSFLGFLWLDFNLLLCSYVVVPVRDFKCSLWQRFGASPVALRRREFVRHAARGRLGVTPARASLWLLLACVFLPEAVMCVVFLCFIWVSEMCVVPYC
jgi:hypothetical protein